MKKHDNLEPIELILGNSNKRFSGVTSTMLQVLPEQQKLINLAVLGKHHLPEGVPAVTFRQLISLCRQPLANGRYRIFHARRNDEMIQALLLKHLFKAKIKIVFTSTAQRYHSKFSRFLMSKMDAIISTCQAAAQYLTERQADILIPHGIDANVYQPALNKQQAWQSLKLPGKYGIGIFGRVRQQKGIDLFVDACVEALPQHPDFTAVIIGEITPDNQAFVEQQKQKIAHAQLQERIVFLGQQPFEKIPILFQAMSLVAALSRNEGFGLTVLEAMSSGAAVLASSAGAWPEIIDNGQNGFCIASNDLPATTAKLKELLSAPNTLDRLGQCGRKKIETHYTNTVEALALVNFFKSLSQNS